MRPGPRIAWGLALAVAAAAGAFAQGLGVRAEGGLVRAVASQTHFMKGATLNRLRNGELLVVAVQVSLLAGPRGSVLARSSGRFAFSFDIWEERCAVSRLGRPGKPVARLTAAEAEQWCLDSLALAETAAPRDAPFWVRLEARAEQPDDAPQSGEDATVMLSRLVEWFSRPKNGGDARVRVESGPWKLGDLRKGG
jgi:hypothetical protein